MTGAVMQEKEDSFLSNKNEYMRITIFLFDRKMTSPLFGMNRRKDKRSSEREREYKEDKEVNLGRCLP